MRRNDNISVHLGPAPLINIFGATMLKYFNYFQKILLYGPPAIHLPRLSLFYHRD
jgi:hypothetical protein